MKFLKKVLKFLIVLIVILAIGVWLFTNSLKPDYSGNIDLNNLEEAVEVYYDDFGVPHIYAQNELDALRSLGYVHAQDRLWQMELMRRIAAGRLSELFGEKMLKNDKFFSSLGIEEEAEKTIKNLDKNSEPYKLAMAYLDGVNQFIEEGATPIEFYLIGLEKEKYTLKDMYNVIGYMGFSFAIAHKTEPVLTEVKEKLGPAYLEELGVTIDSTTTLINNEENTIFESTLASVVNEIYDELPISPFIGSNSWVISPDKTKNGKVIFANDPHIAYSQPAVWYQSHIVTPNYEMYGYNLALTPFPLLGHNRNYAYGLTMFANDDLDFYFEENNPKNELQYATPNGFEDYKILKKTINVKDGDPISYDLRISRHGPIVNDVVEQINDDRPIAMDWVYTNFENKMLDVTYMMSHSTSLTQFREAASNIHAPGLNIMYGDAENNVAWFASGKLHKFKNDVNSKLILNGNSTDDEKEYLDFEQNPQAINPSWNYVYSANNQPDSIAGILYPGYYQPEDRAKRIVNLLEAKDDFTKEDVMEMINDVTSSMTPQMVQWAFQDIDLSSFSKSEQEAITILKNWNGNYNLESVAPTIYNRFLYEFLENTYLDEMGDTFYTFLNTSQQKKTTANQMARTESVWWDDISTKNKTETKTNIISKSLKEAIAFLENQLGEDYNSWTWNRVHTIEHPHPMGQVETLRSYFNVGPFEVNGGKEVINNLAFKLDSTGFYKVNSGPSTRRVVDFSDIENSMSISPTGQSGNPFSDYYKDQAQLYVNGDFVPMDLNKNRIQQSKNKLVLTSEN
ncbi:penicillin acylase family protein [Spongiivirga citrea]|uniref:Penicillin acylase family protein n=1 Tax=Spongiivirga citrea TaxID=1481457 RepID=A0A6M0CJC1_9FLAO|nr:penicillin acylase family protein [Spongiivirga citrea]NER18025.1 penicillin acylase family protein [Spongiivirga citrea]